MARKMEQTQAVAEVQATETQVAQEQTMNKEDKTMKRMERANRITINAKADGFEGRFYRTHKLLATIASTDTTWQADADANSTTNRERYRAYLIDHSEEYGVTWNPTTQTQAWDRKHNTYLTDEQVAEDALTLVTDTIYRLADKCRYDMTIDTLEVTAVTAKESSLSYVEDGRYTKSGAWCVADIEVTIGCHIAEQEMEMLYHMEMKSGQICKPKTTIAEWNEHMAMEIEINGIEIPDSKEEKTA